MQLPTGTVFAGRFTVERHLADGGFGSVYAARDGRGGGRVALKVLHAEWVAKPKVRARFELEATAAERVQSPHAVKVIDAGVDDATGQPWLAMEYLEGETLDALLEREGRLSPERLAALVEQVGDALAAAHGAGVIHADLKPENLMLLGAPPFVKVLDFGIARVLRAGMTSTQVTTTMGSPMWTAPEQFISGSKLRASTDVWPLGMIAFRALTGKPYLLNAQPPERILPCVLEIAQGELPPASVRAAALGVGAHLPADFDAWFAHCVTRDAGQRFQHARAAVTALLTVLRRGAVPATRVLEHVPLLAALSTKGTVAVPPAALVAVAAMMERHDYASARAALASVDDGAAGWALRASCEHRLGRYDDALAAWSEAIAREPGVGAYLHGRAATFDALGMTALAKADRALAAGR